ncbi:unnamed protein product [Cercopithifilaria johnstoni]|uniref:Uncharacterized protein n=1 Tax=Cercopithifilaria johnstoni TaxID=2874296 RepID=A0A8J2PYE0_9BILA|nr:unnamed protein product [Cercopithifilaria johnstoni]
MAIIHVPGLSRTIILLHTSEDNVKMLLKGTLLQSECSAISNLKLSPVTQNTAEVGTAAAIHDIMSLHWRYFLNLSKSSRNVDRGVKEAEGNVRFRGRTKKSTWISSITTSRQFEKFRRESCFEERILVRFLPCLLSLFQIIFEFLLSNL